MSDENMHEQLRQMAAQIQQLTEQKEALKATC